MLGTGSRIEALISRRCRHTPDTVVAVSDSGAMTFGELERSSDRLAQRLRELGVTAGDYVVVSLARDRLLLVAILAVLKAGAAFIPVELPEPPDRIERTVRLAGATWVVTDVESVATYETTALRIVLVDETFLQADAVGTGSRPDAGADGAAYGISTSGSTGTPKVVAVAHRPLVRLVEWLGQRFGIGAGDAGLWVSPGGFDLSMFDLLGLPALGAAVRMVSGPARVDPARCAELLTSEPITFWNSTPALLRSVLPFVRGAGAVARETLRLAFVSGDWVPLSLRAELRAAFPRAELVALGGATEATIWSNYFVVHEVDPSWASIPYGQPVPWARYHVLTPDGRPCAEDARGELYIGGDCLAMGYLGDEELTGTRFPADPFATGPGARMYRTGDEARRWPDGTIELLGRLDDQVNVSGYRVALGEVDAALGRCGLSAAAAASVPNVAGTERIVAAGVPAEPGLTADTVLARLGAVLPAYAHPTPLLLVDQLPLTANGKVDRKAVARLAAPATGDPAVPDPPAVPPAGDVAALLRAEIAEIVGGPADGIGADRPLGELGLNSLGFAVLSGRVFEALGVKVSPVDFYEAGTLDGVVARIAPALPEADPDPGARAPRRRCRRRRGGDGLPPAGRRRPRRVLAHAVARHRPGAPAAGGPGPAHQRRPHGPGRLSRPDRRLRRPAVRHHPA